VAGVGEGVGEAAACDAGADDDDIRLIGGVVGSGLSVEHTMEHT
jgi:hypothetical protein